MNKIDRTMISRRGFLEGSAGLTFGLSIPGVLIARPVAALAEGGVPASIGAWVTIGPDGAIVMAIPVAEMGQGSSTGLAMVFAEEMDADWSRVSIVYPPIKPEIFGNPIFGGMMVTYGSGSIRGYWDKVRLQAAAVRCEARSQ
jgi:isoquinoline 1-oxidoreductase subunit beta